MKDDIIRVPLIRPKKKNDQNVQYVDKKVEDLLCKNQIPKIKKGNDLKKINKEQKVSDTVLFVDENTLISKVVGSFPSTMWIFSQAGMHCIGCPASAFESIKDGCLAHGMSESEIVD
jgi:hybrid cluster-associated redox disulfide protein